MIESTQNKLNFVIGQSAVFPFNIRFFRPEDIKCFINKNNVQTELVRGVDFSVERKENYDNGAHITLLMEPLPSGAVLTILRSCDITQELALPENGKLPSAGMERQLDKLTMIAQQLSEEVGRSIKVGVGESDASPDALLESIYSAAASSEKNANEAARGASSASADAAKAAGSAAAAEASLTQMQIRPLGSVFLYPGSVAPEGAALLDGGTVEQCKERYKAFWAWLKQNGALVEMVPEYKEWTMPSLHSDGTMGGDSYAAATEIPQDTTAHLAFDRDASTFPPKNRDTITFYSPVPIKVNRLVFSRGSAPLIYRYYDVFTSMDGVEQKYLGRVKAFSTGASSGEADISGWFGEENPCCKYIEFVGINDFSEGDLMPCDNLPNIVIEGEEYAGMTAVIPASKIPLMTPEVYKTTLAQFGACGGFVVDEESGDVRLPDVRNAILKAWNGETVGETARVNVGAGDSAMSFLSLAACIQLYNVSASGGEAGTVTPSGAVTSVNGKVGNVTLTAGDLDVYTKGEVDYKFASFNPGTGGSVISVNGKVGNVTITAADLGVYTKSEVDNKLANFTPGTGGDKVISVNGKIGKIILTADDVGAMPRTEAEQINSQMYSDISALLGAMDALLGLNVTTLVLYLSEQVIYGFDYVLPDDGSGYASLQNAETGELYDGTITPGEGQCNFGIIPPGTYYLTIGGDFARISFSIKLLSGEFGDNLTVWQVYGMSVYLTDGGNAFKNCKNLTTLNGVGLPLSLEIADSMFEGCENLELNLDELVPLAPEGGYQITSANYMFNGCTKVTGSRSAFLAVCPNLTEENRIGMFNGTNTTE